MIRGAWLAIALCGLATTAAGETVYVTDILRLGIHEASDTSDRPFDNLVSGARLEILERTAMYARVRTDAGREGWVKSAYLVTDPPAQTRLAALEAELDTLRKEAAAARTARETAEQEAARLHKLMSSDTSSTGALQERVAALTRDNEDYERRLESYRGSLPLPWVGAALLVALAGGFLAGLWWLDASIRRRHGGFRIY